MIVRSHKIQPVIQSQLPDLGSMTKDELEMLRLRLRVETLLLVIRMLYTGLANSSPTAVQAFRDQFARLRQAHSKIALKGMTPEYSDLIAAEHQEVLDDVLTFIESGFRS
jgi:hypothetical protein